MSSNHRNENTGTTGRTTLAIILRLPGPSLASNTDKSRVSAGSAVPGSSSGCGEGIVHACHSPALTWPTLHTETAASVSTLLELETETLNFMIHKM